MSTTRKTLKRVWLSVQPYKLLFWTGMISPVFAVVALNISAPFIISRTFTKLQGAYTSGLQLSGLSFGPYIIAFIVAMLIGFISWRLASYSIWNLQAKVARDQIINIFNHLQKQGVRFHADNFGGALVSQSTKYTSASERLIDILVWEIIPGITALIASITVLAFVEYKYAIIMLVTTAIYIAISSWRVKIQFPYNRKEAEAQTLRTAALSDVVTNVNNIRAFGREKHELQRFTKNANHAYQAYTSLGAISIKNEAIGQVLTNTMRSIAFIFGIIAVVKFNANAGALYLIVAYTMSIVERLWSFTGVVRNINRSLGDAAQMTEILDIEPEIKDPANPEKIQIHRGSIEFKNVSFKHKGSSKQLFEDLNLRIKQGEKIGLVGPSGGGKTSLTSLLMRFNDVDDGEISIDGQNIATITQEDLRQHISYVPQEPLLFHRSIKENIGYGQIDSEDRVIKAIAKMAHADEFIDGLPQGYDTLVGERGVKLSGGQRQRVVIARAMLKNAPILVLDEATSALDSESEVLIQDALWKLMERRTAIVIAHRLSTIQKMDRIIVLEKGKIAEEGSHNELLRKNGIYAKLWAHQSGGFLED